VPRKLCRSPAQPYHCQSPRSGRGQATGATFANYEGVLQIGVPPLRIDIINRIGVPFDEVIAGGERLDVSGHAIPFIGLEALVRSQLAAGRPQDLADVDALRRLHPG